MLGCSKYRYVRYLVAEKDTSKIRNYRPVTYDKLKGWYALYHLPVPTSKDFLFNHSNMHRNYGNWETWIHYDNIDRCNRGVLFNFFNSCDKQNILAF